MKRSSLLTVGLIAISIGLLNAQTNQGKFIVGVSSLHSFASSGSELMSLGYTSIKSKSDADGFQESEPEKSFSINANPKAGYFVIDNLAIGLDLNIGFSIYNLGDDKSSHTTFAVGPFVRYYIPTSKVLPFFELGASYGMMSNKTRLMSLGGGIGLAVPVGERITIDIAAGYKSLTYKYNEEDNERDVFGTLGLKVGFMVLLGSN